MHSSVEELDRSVQVVRNLVHKSAFPASTQDLLPLSAQATFHVAHSSSYCCVNTPPSLLLLLFAVVVLCTI